jgi:hypothetical protein
MDTRGRPFDFRSGQAVRSPDCSGALWSLSDLGIFSPKTGIFDHQNSLAKNQNRLYAILERRLFKVRQTPMSVAFLISEGWALSALSRP